MSGFKRINVIGTSGSGKSTFSRQLSARLSVPYISIDEIFWERNWTEPPDDRFFPKLEAALDKESWVLDGNYDRTRAIKWRNVQLIIWLDYTFSRTLWQVTLRSIKRARSREELWPNTNNRESIYKSFFTRQSIIWWMIKSYGQNRRRYSQLLSEQQGKTPQIIRVRCPKEAANLLAEM